MAERSPSRVLRDALLDVTWAARQLETAIRDARLRLGPVPIKPEVDQELAVALDRVRATIESLVAMRREAEAAAQEERPRGC